MSSTVPKSLQVCCIGVDSQGTKSSIHENHFSVLHIYRTPKCITSISTRKKRSMGIHSLMERGESWYPFDPMVDNKTKVYLSLSCPFFFILFCFLFCPSKPNFFVGCVNHHFTFCGKRRVMRVCVCRLVR